MKHSTLAFTLAIAPSNVISSHGLTPKLCTLAIGSCSTFSQQDKARPKLLLQ